MNLILNSGRTKEVAVIIHKMTKWQKHKANTGKLNEVLESLLVDPVHQGNETSPVARGSASILNVSPQSNETLSGAKRSASNLSLSSQCNEKSPGARGSASNLDVSVTMGPICRGASIQELAQEVHIPDHLKKGNFWDLFRGSQLCRKTLLLSLVWAANAVVYASIAYNTENLGRNIFDMGNSWLGGNPRMLLDTLA